MISRLAIVVAALVTFCVAISAPIHAQSKQSDALTRGNTRSSTLLVALGMRLFADTRFSATRSVSCASCHIPQKAFSDGLAVAVGVHGQRGTRNTPSLWDVASLPSQFWDGRRATLEEQALDPLLHPREHGIADPVELVSIVRTDEQYRADFQSVFDVAAEQVNAGHIAVALAAFERTLMSDSSAFDRYYYQEQKDALPAAAVRGLDLFNGRARCATCHVMDGPRATFTDHKFHSLGVSLNALLPRLAELTQRVAKADARTLDRLIAEDADIAALGRFVLTKDPRDIGKFRTPSLRNVDLTAPYMHDGSLATLKAAIDAEIYYRSLEANRPLILTPTEKADLVAFLEALTSSNAKSCILKPRAARESEI